ncbi:MAG: cytochrome P450 [Scytonema sp. PMC 1069.18]|nr:cytochrome P450 [Scytonema sp. PMC 1069.18]MEC4883849.1 cytochrome P450 [Scytonema sp. PMC 1070.18]
MAKYKVPNSPKTFKRWQKLQWLTRQEEYLQECYKKYGDVFALRVGPDFIPYVFISNPQIIQEIFAANSQQLDSGKEATNNPFFLGERSLVSLAGQRHKQQRKLLAPCLHGERIQIYSQLICSLAEQMASNWTIDQPIFIYKALQAIMLELGFQVLLGSKDGQRYERLKELLISMMNPENPLSRSLAYYIPFLQKNIGPWKVWEKFTDEQRQINEILYAEIHDHRQNPDPSGTDILSLMMASRYETGEAMTDEELRDELITLMAQSPEVTGTSLARAFYWILHNSQVHQKLLQELDSLGDAPNPKEIMRLPYLDAIFKEVMRIYPTALFTFPRLVKTTLQIQDYQFEPGTVLLPCIHLIHHREDVYPQAKQFKPERFLERDFSPYEYFPFGGGHRRCIGSAFAQLEMKLVLATVLSHWHLELDRSMPKPSYKGALLPPVGSIQIVLKGRRSRNQLESTTPHHNLSVIH